MLTRITGPPCRFDDVCAHFKPVMHHFFLESFRDPATWFERRLSYTRSVAVSSIAGALPGSARHSCDDARAQWLAV